MGRLYFMRGVLGYILTLNTFTHAYSVKQEDLWCTWGPDLFCKIQWLLNFALGLRWINKMLCRYLVVGRLCNHTNVFFGEWNRQDFRKWQDSQCMLKIIRLFFSYSSINTWPKQDRSIKFRLMVEPDLPVWSPIRVVNSHREHTIKINVFNASWL